MTRDNRRTVMEYLILILVFIIWGSTYVVSKVLMNELPVFFVSFCRYLVAWIILTLFLAVRGSVTKSRPEPYDKRGRIALLLFGLIGYTISIDCQLAGTKLIAASTASLINSANPVGITLMSVLFLKEPLTGSHAAGICLALFGVYLILGQGGGTSNPVGIVLSIISVTLWSLATIISRRELSRFDPVKVTRDGMSIAVICNFFLCAAEIISSGSGLSLNLASVAGLLYLGCFCTACTHLLWNRALHIFPANTCSSFYPIQPLSSTVLGVIFLHETVGLPFFAGAAFIVAGILLSLHQKRPPDDSSS